MSLSFDVFTSQMGRLQGTFGKSVFSDERMKIINSFTSKLTDKEFRKLCGFFLETRKTPPLPIDFRDGVHRLMKQRPEWLQQYDSDNTPPLPINCHHCVDAGVLVVHHESTKKKLYAMSCSCKLGKLKNEWALPEFCHDSDYQLVGNAYFFKTIVEKRGFSGARDYWKQIINESKTYWGEME